MKVFGGDLATLEHIATKIRAAMWTVRGITDLAIFDALGQLTLTIDIDRDRAARYGLAPGDINATIQAGIGGQAAGNLYEPGSDRNFPIVVRLKPEFRQSVDAIRNLALNVANPGGSGNIQIPLSEVARVTLASGPAMIYREEPGALCSDQIRRPQARPRGRRARGAGEGRGGRPASARAIASSGSASSAI